MDIVINALPYKKNSSGIGVMIRELYGAYTGIARHRCRVILSHDSPEFPEGGGAGLVRIPWDHSHSLRRLLFQTFTMGRRYCRNAVVLTTDSKSPLFLPKSCILAPLITDLAVYRMPEVYQRSRVLLWRLQYRYVRHRADFFLAISEFTKKEMVNLWGISPEQIFVIPCACPPGLARESRPERLEQLRKKYNLPGQFVLFVGNSNPRKNLTRLLRAFDRAKTEGRLPHQLIIAGEQGWKFNRMQAVEGLENREDVRFIGFVPDEDMPALYSAAALFAFPTLYEGFGIPVLEAQACGVPVLTSQCSALPEVGGAGAYYVDPYDEGSISDGIQVVLRDRALAEGLVRRGLENVRRFSWAESARRLDEIIEQKVGR